MRARVCVCVLGTSFKKVFKLSICIYTYTYIYDCIYVYVYIYIEKKERERERRNERVRAKISERERERPRSSAFTPPSCLRACVVSFGIAASWSGSEREDALGPKAAIGRGIR